MRHLDSWLPIDELAERPIWYVNAPGGQIVLKNISAEIVRDGKPHKAKLELPRDLADFFDLSFIDEELDEDVIMKALTGKSKRIAIREVSMTSDDVIHILISGPGFRKELDIINFDDSVREFDVFVHNSKRRSAGRVERYTITVASEFLRIAEWRNSAESADDEPDWSEENVFTLYCNEPDRFYQENIRV